MINKIVFAVIYWMFYMNKKNPLIQTVEEMTQQLLNVKSRNKKIM